MTKTVLITGSSSGFGKAAVGLFLEAGWNVAATMRNPRAWSGADGSNRLVISTLDVCDPVSIRGATDGAIRRFGGVDCLVNDAGQALASVFESTPMEKARALFETNFFGVAEVTQALLPHFRERGGGRIVNVSSSSAISAEPLMAFYSASKGAVEGLTEALRFELEPQNIVVKLVEPGFVPTTHLMAAAEKRSSAVPVPAAYQAFVGKALAIYSAPWPYAQTTAEMVAQAILNAATDETKRLRYVVGEDAIEAAHMRRETSEDQYIAWRDARAVR